MSKRKEEQKDHFVCVPLSQVKDRSSISLFRFYYKLKKRSIHKQDYAFYSFEVNPHKPIHFLFLLFSKCSYITPMKLDQLQ